MKTKMRVKALAAGLMTAVLVAAGAGFWAVEALAQKPAAMVTKSLSKEKPVPPELGRAVAGNNAFAVDLYKKLAGKESGNLIFSPYSISTALAMTYGGARELTEEQMAKTLHFTLGHDLLHPAFGWLINDLNKRGKKGNFELVVANRLWAQAGYQFLDSYLKLVTENYGAAIETADFAADPEAARKVINAWVERQTKNRIKNLIPPRVIDELTRLVLVNAIYFKGKWAAEFKEEDTTDAPFWLTPDQEVEVKMMRQEGTFRYADNKTLQLLMMPYRGEELSMVILLPRERGGLRELEQMLTAEGIEQIINGAFPFQTLVYLPRFKIEYGMGMKKALSEMGMPIAFSDAADFSGMDGTKMLKIQDVIHKAFIEVNEEGAEAAAATAVVVGVKSAAPMRGEFKADHPFIYLIRDNKTGTILFMGRVMDPR